MSSRLKQLVRKHGLEAAAAVLPDAALSRVVERATSGFDVALCLHRVLADPRSDVLMPELTHTPEEIDRFLECFDRVPGRLTMTFDDGYEDARVYIQDRAPRHPDVDWLFMVCPRKTIERRGFTWDDWVHDGNGGDPSEFIEAWESSTRRGDDSAGGVATRAELGAYRLSTVDECLELAEAPNVDLGDHTDNHFAMTWLSDVEVDREILDSQARFEAAFGQCSHFAFPFGAQPHVDPAHVDRATDLISGTVWTIESRPFRVAQREHTAVRPRFAWFSTGPSPRAMALFVALKCLVERRRS